jgi:hypothetical protein
MAVPRRRRQSNRAVLVLAASILAHTVGLGYVATKPIDLPVAPTYAEPNTPVEFAPRLRPRSEKTKPTEQARKPQPLDRIVARQAEVATVDPAPFATSPPLAAPIAPLSPPGDGGSEDPNDLGAGPPDLTASTPPPGHYPINPGYWQVAYHWLLLSHTDRYCVEPRNITRFMAAPCNHLYHCSYPVQQIEADRFHFAGVIWRHDERYNVTGGGAYSPTTLRFSVTGMGHFHILPFAFSASLDGQYLGPDCPAGAKRIRQSEASTAG